MEELSSIEIISIAVVTIVVFFYGLAFFLSFRKSSNNERKVANNMSMDEEISEYLVDTNKEYFDNISDKTKEEKYASLKQYRDAKKEKERKTNRVSNVFTVIFYVFILLLLAGGILVRASGDQLFIGSSTYLVIESGSMSEKNAANSYLTDESLTSKYDMDNQFVTFDLIKIDKIQSESEIKLYDVVAYKSASGSIIVHRVIDIVTGTDGNHYKFRGDANNASSDYEYHGHDGSGLGLTMSDFVGKYSGWHSYGLGLAIDYLKSDIGLICLASGIIVVGFYYHYESKSNKTINSREDYITRKIDEGTDVRYKWYQIRYRTTKPYKILTDDLYIDSDDGFPK